MTVPALFDDRYPRFTRQVAFLEAPISKVIEAQDRWWFSEDKVHVRSRSELDSLETILAKGFDWNLLVACEPRWTALFGPELADGPGLVLSEFGGFRAVYAADVPDQMVRLTVAAPAGERTVMAYEDGGSWRFHGLGDPLPFEQPETYGAGRIRNRLPRDLRHEYLAALGIRMADPTFYSGQRVSVRMEGLGSIVKRALRLG